MSDQDGQDQEKERQMYIWYSLEEKEKIYGCSERDMKEEIRRGTEKKWKTLGVLLVAGIIGLHMQHHLEERQPGIHMSHCLIHVLKAF